MASYNSDYEANCIAGEDVTSPESPVGPCITTVLDLRDKKNPLEGFVVEDCAVPEALSPFMYGLMEYLPDELVPSYGLVKAVLKRAARLGSKHFGPYFPRGSIRRTPVYLIMSHDSQCPDVSQVIHLPM